MDMQPDERPPELLQSPFRGDNHFMAQAMREALNAFEDDEVPVGAVVVKDGRVIGRGFNQRELLHDPTAHAEMIAITAAAEALGDWRLEDCDLYVTLEPCPMCAGAIVNARVRKVVYGASDPKAGACGTLYNLVQDARLNHRCELVSGVMADESGDLLREFFRQRRDKKDGKPRERDGSV